MNLGDGAALARYDERRLTAADRWILSGLNRLVREVTDNLEKFELGIALQKLYEFVWDEFCDWYIELVKPRLSGADETGRPEALAVLRYVLVQSLKLLHPFMPFITEEIYRAFGKPAASESVSAAPASAAVPSASAAAGAFGVGGFDAFGGAESLMISEWPRSETRFEAESERRGIAFVIDVIRGVRNLRSEMDVPPKNKVSCVFVTREADKAGALIEGRAFIERLASIRAFTVQEDRTGVAPDAVTLVAGGVEAFIPLGELVDVQKEVARLEKELTSLAKEIERSAGRLANPGFTEKAPPKVVGEEREKLKQYQDAHEKVGANLKRLKGV
jgi:valyl-tRNA synthetase